MSDATRQLSEAAYQSAFNSMVAILEKARSADEVLRAAGRGLEGLDASLMGANKMAQATVACRAGCSFCCSLRIDVRAHEVFLLARYLKAHRTEEELAAIRSAAAEIRDVVRDMTDAERNASSIPCVLLEGGKCTVYAARPAACRRYFSSSVAACESLYKNPESSSEIEHPFVQNFGRHVANGIHNALFQSGYDAYSYDLPSALAEALDEPMREMRWYARMKAFSAGAESKVPDGFSQREAIDRLQRALPARPEPESDPTDFYA